MEAQKPRGALRKGSSGASITYELHQTSHTIRMESTAFLNQNFPGDLELGLRDPRQQPTQGSPEPEPGPPGPSHSSDPIDVPSNIANRQCSVKTRARALSSILLLFGVTALLTILYLVYVHQALLAADPRIPDALMEARTANWILSICSTIFASLVAYLLGDVLNHARWLLAARVEGIPLALFAVMGSATEWHASAFISLGNWKSPATWAFGIVRLGLPLATIYYGAILKFNADFEYIFRENGPPVQVYAGLAPMDPRVLSLGPLRPSRIAMYFQAFTQVLLSYEQYTVGMPAPNCDGVCRSFLIPGGLETARALNGSLLNSTLLEGGLFQDHEAIGIHNAPGFLLAYKPLPPTSDFDRNHECTVYGHGFNDAIQICTRPAPPSLEVGWAPCPTRLSDRKRCFNDTSWTRAPIRTKLSMSAYKQYSTTSYRRKDLHILDVTLTSEPQAVPLNESDYQLLWRRMLVPTDQANSLDRSMIDSVTFSLAWLQRLYDDEFPDDANTPMEHLENFLAIPLQFMVTAIQFANSTIQEQSGDPDGFGSLQFPLPADMLTTAVGVRIMERLKGQTWVVCLFTVTAVLAVLFIGALLVWMVFFQRYRPAAITGVPDMDIAEKFRCCIRSGGPEGTGLAGPNAGTGKKSWWQKVPMLAGLVARLRKGAMLGGLVAKLRTDDSGREVLLIEPSGLRSIRTTLSWESGIPLLAISRSTRGASRVG